MERSRRSATWYFVVLKLHVDDADTRLVLKNLRSHSLHFEGNGVIWVIVNIVCKPARCPRGHVRLPTAYLIAGIRD